MYNERLLAQTEPYGSEMCNPLAKQAGSKKRLVQDVSSEETSCPGGSSENSNCQETGQEEKSFLIECFFVFFS